MANRIPTRDAYSFQFVTADSRNVDWIAISVERDGYELILPTPTYGDWQDHDSDAPAHVVRRKASAYLNDADTDAFTGTRGYDEWRDGFEPMMNYAWPVSLAHGLDVSDAVAQMAKFAPSCTLIELGEGVREEMFGGGYDAPDYVIALNGGGMNLSDHIAAAYIACGCIPPERILSGLAGVISEDKARAIGLRRIYREASTFFRNRAATLAREASRVFAKR